MKPCTRLPDLDWVRTREAWLQELARAMAPVIEVKAGLQLPPYRVSCGFPSRGGLLGGKTRVRGECWSPEASEDGHAEVLVSPVEDDVREVAALMVHELIHAALPEVGHRRPFQQAARALDHQAPFVEVTPTPRFWNWAEPLIAGLPAYPHRRLNALRPVAAPKRQSNRHIKCQCTECGYIVRTARRWIETAGPPLCPQHGPMAVESAEEESEAADAVGLAVAAAASARSLSGCGSK